MFTKTLTVLAALLAVSVSALAADYIEIKGAQDIDNIRIPLKGRTAYHTELQALPSPSNDKETGFYVGYALSAKLSGKRIEGTFTGNLFEGFIDFGVMDESQKFSPVLKSFEKKFSLKEPSQNWTKVTVSEKTSYQIRWITD